MQKGVQKDEQTTPFFEKVLHLSQSLNHDKSGFSSCRQLVPVFRSLLLAATWNTATPCFGSALNLTSWHDVIRSLVQIESERVLLEKTLRSSSEAEQLLSVQYLLHLNEAMHERYHPLIGLEQIVIPLLISNNRDMESQGQLHFSLDTMNGILDAVFPTTNTIPEEEQDDDGTLSRCLTRIISKRDDDTLVLKEKWDRSCLILARLWEAAPSIRSQLRPAVRDQIIFAVTAATASSALRMEQFCTYRDYLRPLSNDLIPLLLEEGTPLEYASSLWDVAAQLDFQQNESDLIVRLTIATTLACALLPSLRRQTNSSLISDPWLWDLMQRCLAQGTIRLPLKETWRELSWNDELRETKEVQNIEDINSLEILRRRGLYLLRVLVEEEGADLLPWKQYVACFETLEMESQPHLVDQVWKTVSELFCDAAENSDPDTSSIFPPKLSWDWLMLLLGRIITSEDSPTLRKLSLYRLFKGQAGVLVTDHTHVPSSGQQKKRDKKNNRRRQGSGSEQGSVGAPITMISNEFIFDVILPSYDTLSSTVGLMMHIEHNHRMIREDVSELLSNFLSTYLSAIRQHEEALNDFVCRLWRPNFLCRLHRKTCVHVLGVSSKKIQAWTDEQRCLSVSSAMLDLMVSSFERLLSFGSVISAYQDSIRLSFAMILSASGTKGKLNPKSVLNVLALYPFPPTWSMDAIMHPDELVVEGGEPSRMSDSVLSWQALGAWIRSCDDTFAWAKSVAPAIASAFVDGLLNSHDNVYESDWDYRRGASESERKLSKAVCMFCALVASGASNDITAGEMLWPAIYKGLTHVSATVLSSNSSKADMISRALLLLENGSKLQVLSGLGNGDIVVEKRTQHMMPPPPNVELLLGNAVSFVLYHIRKILAIDEIESESSFSQGARDDNARKLNATFADLISQLQTLQEAFPSSLALSSSVEGVLKENLGCLLIGSGERNIVLQTALVYAAMSCGAELDSDSVLEACKTLLEIQLVDSTIVSRSDKTARSVFQYGRWGALSTLLPQLFAAKHDDAEVRNFIERLLTVCTDVVEATPQEALVPLFSCVRTSVGAICSPSSTKNSDSRTVPLASMIDVLVRIMLECKSSSNAMFMLDRICGLIFQPSLLLEEYELARNDEDAFLPIKQAFRNFIQMAGTSRPHISRIVLSRISYGWLGNPNDDSCGLGAIPYRDAIVELLLHKEIRITESSASQYELPPDRSEEKLHPPPCADDSSISRGFLLVFLSNLPSDDRLNEKVRSELVQHIIFALLDRLKPNGEPLVMIGSPPYCLKMRGWQALCILTKHVSADIADRTCTSTFDALAESLHGQLRYFIEAFAIQCSRRHPVIFGRALVENIMKKNLSLQMISSLMILAGNLIVGRYEHDFMPKFIAGDESCNALDSILSGVIPWLGSTQGFSRAIAQLLAHKLIPHVVDVSKEADPKSNDWYLRSIFDFLDHNVEMVRIRKKQSNFFNQFDTDRVCSVDGILAIDVDEGGEADPVHMIDAIKQCLQEVYLDAHANDVPTWKIVDDMLKEQEPTQIVDKTTDEVVNFQRKIIPVDALNLAMESVKERRLRNVAGRQKQRLIVCASLVDKVPNLGGLARTAEIFAAEKLVIPDKRVAKMDNFKSLAVGADDWVELEECKEEQLLEWLRKKRKQGYFIVGLEQTSSSVSLSKFDFPDRPTVLLLGKEKEGIPVEYLQAVDQCIEIPQLGIIRSLNVHVSGAIAIWEHTRQKILDDKIRLS